MGACKSYPDSQQPPKCSPKLKPWRPRPKRAGEGSALPYLDTLQSYFPGDDFSGNAEVLKFMRSLRPITEIRGEPTVLVAAHPVKGATTENLVPYGGGAILNEIDGNFTQTPSPDGKTTKLHWFGKLREADFEPIDC